MINHMMSLNGGRSGYVEQGVVCNKGGICDMIKSIYGFALGCFFIYDGNLFKVTQFPTRNSVCGKLVHKFMEPCPFTVKISILEVTQLDTMDWAIDRAKERRVKWLEQSRDAT
jgi:hypothetical protein